MKRTISPHSRKSKGRLLQKKIVQELRDHFAMDEDAKTHYEGDIQAIPMGCSGIDIKLSPAAQNKIPFDIEAKCQESINIWSAMRQAEMNADPSRIPLVVFKRNRSKVYACLELSHLLTLVAGTIITEEGE